MYSIAAKIRSIAVETLRFWNGDKDARVGKILMALHDPKYAKDYRADIAELHKMAEGIDDAIAAKDAEIERLRARVAGLERELAKPKAAHSTSDFGHVIMRGENERS